MDTSPSVQYIITACVCQESQISGNIPAKPYARAIYSGTRSKAVYLAFFLNLRSFTQTSADRKGTSTRKYLGFDGGASMSMAGT